MSAAITPGTYRTPSGALVHCTPAADGSLRLDVEDPSHRRVGGEGLVKLSDDPHWPDGPRPAADPLLFSD